ncbi:nucleotide disphospho-sugar-binding domain-containing protein [Propioniciclava tarda]|uniref:nucleotide disphospho-sugar-binding domain-containing protein n=1 Tax=Propioniciclava tarda TaxID=433330 RepID=UPI0011676E2A|nr:nucleotide disphospho-sugar-binding domain-containing protein [Propioniciclava tarda]SMO36666.1 hypothetical protein SAMN06266982_101320 [Propioniciclava tarda]
MGVIGRVIARREADLRRLFGNQLSGPTDPASDAGWGRPGNETATAGRAGGGARPAATRKGFFTDTSICIGCKACEVACKEWNRVPPRVAEAPGGGEHGHDAPAVHEFGSSYDNTGHLGPDTWRHVAFIEQGPDQLAAARASGRRLLTISPVRHLGGFGRRGFYGLSCIRVVLLSGWGGLAADSSGRLLVIDEAPHDWLCPRSAGVVHHGGAGTTGAGVVAGVPALVVPFAVDQPFWGARLAALGVGPQPIPRRRLTAENLAAALVSLRDDADQRRRASELGRHARSEPGVAGAVAVFGRLSVAR